MKSKYFILLLALAFISQIQSVYIKSNSLKQQSFDKNNNLNQRDSYLLKGNTQQNDPSKNQLLTNQQQVISQKKQSIALSRIGLQSHLSEPIFLTKMSHQKRKSINQQSQALDNLSNTLSTSTQNLRNYIGQYNVNDIQKYAFIIIVAILSVLTGYAIQQSQKLKCKIDEMKQKYEKADKQRRKQLKLQTKSSQKQIPLPEQQQQSQTNELQAKIRI